MTYTDWPFPQPPNGAALTTSAVAFAAAPIVFVRHAAADDGWEFFDVERPDVGRHGSILQLGAIAVLDPSVLTLADLPAGWVARRRSPLDAWERAPDPGHDRLAEIARAW